MHAHVVIMMFINDCIYVTKKIFDSYTYIYIYIERERERERERHHRKPNYDN